MENNKYALRYLSHFEEDLNKIVSYYQNTLIARIKKSC